MGKRIENIKFVISGHVAPPAAVWVLHPLRFHLQSSSQELLVDPGQFLLSPPPPPPPLPLLPLSSLSCSGEGGNIKWGGGKGGYASERYHKENYCIG